MKAKEIFFVTLLAILFVSNTSAAGNDCKLNRYVNEQRSSQYARLNPSKSAPSEFLVDERRDSFAASFEYYSGRKSEWQKLSQYFDQNCITALLVLHEGKIVIEQYALGRRPTDTLTSASMSKTLTALSIGLLIDQELLGTQQKVSSILTDFADSPFGGDTVEDLLRMTSATKLVDGYSDAPDKTGDNTLLHPLTTPLTNARQYLASKREASAKSGERFFYSAANTALLAVIAQQVTNQPISSIFEQGIWRHIATSSGYWQLNRRGDVGVQCCFLATLRDWGRIGQLVAQRGQFGGVQLLSKPFMQSFSSANLNKGQPSNGNRYGYQVWLPRFLPENSAESVEFRGAFGQYLFADPINNIVIVHTAVAPSENHPFNDWAPLRNAIVKTLTR